MLLDLERNMSNMYASMEVVDASDNRRIRCAEVPLEIRGNMTSGEGFRSSSFEYPFL
jgi:hypothetical protein